MAPPLAARNLALRRRRGLLRDPLFAGAPLRAAREVDQRGPQHLVAHAIAAAQLSHNRPFRIL